MISRNHSFSAAVCFILLILIACTGPKSSDETSLASDSLADDSTQSVSSDAQIEQVAEEPVEEETTQWDEAMQKCFTPEQIVTVKKAKSEFKNLKTSEEMAHYYNTTMQDIFKLVNDRIAVTNPELYSGDDSPSKQWSWFAEYYPAVKLSVDCSECMYEPSADVRQLIHAASNTKGNEDEIFFDLVDIGSTPSYELVACDFCAASTLGDNRSSKMLSLVERATPANALFGEQISYYRRSALGVAGNYFFYDKPKVLSEIDLMLKSKILTAEERTTLKETRDQLASNETKVQFNCGTAECDWSGVE